MHSIDVSKGSINTAVSSQWFERPADQRFTSLSDLHEAVALAESASREVELQPKALKAIASDMETLHIEADGKLYSPTHYGFSDVAAQAKAPASYLRSVPAPLAALNLNYGLRAAEQKDRALYVQEADNIGTLRCITSTAYGRITDREVVEAVMKVAGDGVGDTKWKVPGTIDWGGAHGVTYNPKVDVTKENTTLFASDRDVFMFLVDDLNPIEVGKLKNGEPDLMFRGFYVWNSEVGRRTFGVATMYLRGVCQNRCLWGVEGFKEISFAHTSGAPDRFGLEAMPALESFAGGNTSKVVKGVKAAKRLRLSTNEEERIEVLTGFGFSRKQALEMIGIATEEEGSPPESAWDYAQCITATARRIEHQDARIDMERVAGKLLDKVPA